MKDDLDIIRELERSINHPLPRKQLGQTLPRVFELADADRKHPGYGFDSFIGYPTRGCFVDPNGSVVGLALESSSAEMIIPRFVFDLQQLRNLSRNSIGEVPKDIDRLQELDRLSLVRRDDILHLYVEK